MAVIIFGEYTLKLLSYSGEYDLHGNWMVCFAGRIALNTTLRYAFQTITNDTGEESNLPKHIRTGIAMQCQFIEPLLQIEHLFIDLEISVDDRFGVKNLIWREGSVGVDGTHFVKVAVSISCIAASWHLFVFCFGDQISLLFNIF